MIGFHLSLDAKQLGQLDELRTRASNTAVAKALTFTAKDSQLALKQQIPSHFVLRRQWIVTGIRIKPANGGKLIAQVGSIDKYMDRHVVGASRDKQPDRALHVRKTNNAKGRRASGGILIKPYGDIGSAPTHTVVRRQLRRMDSQKKKTFQIISKKGKVLIVKRTTKKRQPLQTVAMLTDQVNVPKQWDMFGTVRGVVQARFPGHFFRAIARASK
jgi:hypothetical protein